MTVPSVVCEARKVAYRQTKEGLVVAFVIHPNDMPDALAVAPLGQRYMLALAAIGDDEQPLGTETFGNADTRPPEAHVIPATASQRGKERYAASTEMQQAMIRSAQLPNDVRYREWIGNHYGYDPGAVTNFLAVTLLRKECQIGSRSRIADDPDAYERFLRHELAFKQATGQIAEIR